MSNHHARLKPPEKHKDRLFATFVVAAILGILAVTFYEGFLSQRSGQIWPSVTGHVLQTRIVLVGARGGGAYRPGIIDYRAEAHVAYDLNGVHHDEWLPASNVVSDKAYLEFWLSQKESKLCIVHWNPRNPADIEAVLS
jgi:hypothetical protein